MHIKTKNENVRNVNIEHIVFRQANKNIGMNMRVVIIENKIRTEIKILEILKNIIIIIIIKMANKNINK